jgi:hypothetical protein
MAKTAGREVEVGLGVEATAGTAVAATAWAKWLSFSMQGIAEKSLFSGARGIRTKMSDSMIKRKYGQGSLQVVADPLIAMYLFRLLLGSKASTTAAGESAVYDHTLTVQNANASVKTFTLTSKVGGVVNQRYPNSVINSLSIEFADEWATMTADIIGQFVDTAGSPTPAYTEQSLLAYHQATVKFGTSISNANSASATPLKAFSLNINNNVLLDEGFLSGANTITSGNLIAGTLEMSGSYTLQFADTTELDKYKANTRNAAVFQLTGASIGVVTTPEKIKIQLSKLTLTKPPLEYNIDGLVTLTQEFTVEYSSTETKSIDVIVTNGDSGASL